MAVSPSSGSGASESKPAESSGTGSVRGSGPEGCSPTVADVLAGAGDAAVPAASRA
jgi:hypothetical protein